MSDVKDVYDDLDSGIGFEKFEELVEDKVEEMGGLLDKEGAAILVAEDFDKGVVNSIDSITEDMDNVEFTGKVVSVGDLRTFERDDDDEDTGKVCNIHVGDETGQIKVAVWGGMAQAAASDLENGEVLRVKGYPKDGMSGLEVSANDIEHESDTDIEVRTFDTYQIEDLENGLSDVNVTGVVLDTSETNTFDRDDGSTGRVSNILIGDETGRIQVTLWDEKAKLSSEYEYRDVLKIVNGRVKERDGDLELHTGSRSELNEVDEYIEYRPDTTDIENVAIGDSATITGAVVYVGDTNTFERDDGSESTVKNIEIEDSTDRIRVSLWGEMADMDIEKQDVLVIFNADIQDGMEGDVEASAGWRSNVIITERRSNKYESSDTDDSKSTDESDPTGLRDYDGDGEEAQEDQTETESDTEGDQTSTDDSPEEVEVSGMVIGSEDGTITLDGANKQITVITDGDHRLGEELTVRGEMVDGDLEAEEIF
jgi:replication factor A1